MGEFVCLMEGKERKEGKMIGKAGNSENGESKRGRFHLNANSLKGFWVFNVRTRGRDSGVTGTQVLF